MSHYKVNKKINYECPKNSRICTFCNLPNHNCKNCEIESECAPMLKSFIGDYMERYIGQNVHCPKCKNENSTEKTLRVLNDNTPSWDLQCTDCLAMFEVKSKCLSVNNLPLDINLNHGVYNEYMKQLEKGLNLFVIIYKVSRERKLIEISKLLYIDNIILKNKAVINVVPRMNRLSSINIPNYTNRNIKDLTCDLNIMPIHFGNHVKRYMMKNIDKIFDIFHYAPIINVENREIYINNITQQFVV